METTELIKDPSVASSSNGSQSQAQPTINELIEKQKQLFIEEYQKLVEKTNVELYIFRSTVDNKHSEVLGIRYKD